MTSRLSPPRSPLVLLQDDEVDALLSEIALVDAHHVSAAALDSQPSDPAGPTLSSGVQRALVASPHHQRQQPLSLRLAKKRSGAKQKVSSSVANRARDARRGEVIFLRKKVAELELQLAETKERLGVHHHRHRRQSKDARGLDGALPSDSSKGTSLSSGSVAADAEAKKRGAGLWKEIETRQSDKRAKAERENIQLRLVLKTQLKAARGLDKMLLKTTSTKDFEKLLEGHPRFRWAMDSPAPPPDDSDALLVGELLEGLEQSYLEAEAVFESNGLARTSGNTRIDAVVRPDERSGIQLEVFASKVLPFDMRSTGAVAWNNYAHSRDRLPNRAYRHNTPQTMNAAKDTILEDYNLEIDQNNSNAWYRGRLAMRRYVEDQRVVIVWREFFDALLIANEPAGGLRFLGRGYAVIRDAPTRPYSEQQQCGSSSSTAVLQISYLVSPVASGNLANANASKIDTIIDFEICAIAANISSTHEMIETGLLHQATKARWSLDD